MIVYEQNRVPSSTGPVRGVLPDAGVPQREITAMRFSDGCIATDVQLARLVRNALEWSPFLEGVTIDVVTANGTVTLNGSCPYRSLGRMALMIAYTVPGVRSVVNNIRIAHDPVL